jgi:butyrate kinase
LKLAVDKDVTTIETHILNLTNGNENVTLYSNETTGVVCIAVLVRLKFITRDTQKETLEKNQLNGLFQFVSPAMTNNIGDILKTYTSLFTRTKTLATTHNSALDVPSDLNAQLRQSNS